MKLSFRLTALAVFLLSGSVSGMADQPPSREQLKQEYVRPTRVPYPADDPYDAQKAHLGQMLFFEPRLSGSKWIACSSCHNPGMSWSDALPRGIGAGMKPLARRTPTILNLAWSDLLMWDGRKTGLEDQAFGPITSPDEMNGTIEELILRISAIPAYQAEFKKVFGAEGVSERGIRQSIATYERTVVSGQAPFDRWISGDDAAISDSAKRGFDLFNGKANCAVCHSGWNFTDNGFHDIGLSDSDIGRGAWLKLQSMQQAFKTPTLRDIYRRGPYMHDGSITTLVEVIDHYDRGGTVRPSLSDEMRPLHLSGPEKQDLLAFLATLTGDDPPVTFPVLPSSQTAAR
ncbi:MAG: cytochrome c peroxidase [Aliidongia sp.]